MPSTGYLRVDVPTKSLVISLPNPFSEKTETVQLTIVRGEISDTTPIIKIHTSSPTTTRPTMQII